MQGSRMNAEENLEQDELLHASIKAEMSLPPNGLFTLKTALWCRHTCRHSF